MCARHSKSRNIPLEWVTDTVVTADATVTNGEFDLNLLPDEIAMILAIDSTMEVDVIPDAADDEIDLSMLLSMDPDADDTPATPGNLEDLEVFFHHWASFQQQVGAAGTATLRKTASKLLMLPDKYPILVGTNLAQVVVGDATIASTFITRIYFKRKRATQSDLNQILLKRR